VVVSEGAVSFACRQLGVPAAAISQTTVRLANTGGTKRCQRVVARVITGFADCVYGAATAALAGAVPRDVFLGFLERRALRIGAVVGRRLQRALALLAWAGDAMSSRPSTRVLERGGCMA